MRQASSVSRARLKTRRQLLGIGPSRAGNPRSHARLLALERAEELAQALVTGPLDDPSLGAVERQAAAIRALDATYPLASTSLEIELPADAGEVGAMSWADMQRLAARMLDEG